MSDPTKRSPEYQAALDKNLRNAATRAQAKQRSSMGEDRNSKTLDRLPLFADERSLSEAVLGRGRYTHWRAVVPLLEGRGFPKVDGLMGGRYVPAVKAFFDREYRVTGEAQISAPHSPAQLGASHGRRRTAGDADRQTRR